jgi:hypothetical protein
MFFDLCPHFNEGLLDLQLFCLFAEVGPGVVDCTVAVKTISSLIAHISLSPSVRLRLFCR